MLTPKARLGKRRLSHSELFPDVHNFLREILGTLKTRTKLTMVSLALVHES